MDGGSTHNAVRLDVGSLECNGDAVKEDEDQHGVIEHPVSDDLLTAHTEPAHKSNDVIQVSS